jgi:hypothetical protein
MMYTTKAAATKVRTSPIAAISANPRDSFGELHLDGLQLGLCDVLGLFIMRALASGLPPSCRTRIRLRAKPSLA